MFSLEGVWNSVHIDDLRDPEDMSLNLLDFCGTRISSLLKRALPGKSCACSTPTAVLMFFELFF